MSGDKLEYIREGVRLFNEGRFWEAHEAWERVWLQEAGPEKEALQGLILLAAAFYHQKRGNGRGMASTLRRSYEKLKALDAYYGLDLRRLREGIAPLLELGEELLGMAKAPRLEAPTE